MARVVTAAVMVEHGRVLVARRAKGQSNAGKWEFPGGKLEPGETEQACLERELMEELGIEVTVGDFVQDSMYRYERGEILLRAYHVSRTGGEIRLTVHDEVRWVPVEALPQMDLTPADRPIAMALLEGAQDV